MFKNSEWEECGAKKGTLQCTGAPWPGSEQASSEKENNMNADQHYIILINCLTVMSMVIVTPFVKVCICLSYTLVSFIGATVS